MHYLIDGYNLLFALFEKIDPLREKREIVISSLQTALSYTSLDLTIVFDSRFVISDNFPKRFSKSSLEIIYTPSGLCADEYIIELLSCIRHTATETVVTSDKFLSKRVKSLGAKVQTISDFLAYLAKKEAISTKKEEKSHKETSHEVERLLKIFEEKLKEEE